jgi:flagellar assembly factor FliW
MYGEMAMSGTGPATVNMGAVAATQPERVEVESRFGRITINPQQSILFPAGLLGMPNKLQFCLASFPSEKMQRFTIMQSAEDDKLSFITLPLDLINPLIEEADIRQAAKDLDLPLDDLLILLIVSVHRESGAAKLSVNARAPVFIRGSMKVAAQYVFPHTKYLIRQPLSL